jgi:hypothetical protein
LAKNWSQGQLTPVFFYDLPSKVKLKTEEFMKKLLISLLCLASTHSFAQVSDVNVFTDSRVDQLPASDITRLQGRVKIGFTISAGGLVDIVGLAATGPTFSNDWATLKTSNGSTDPVNLAFRNIYLRKVMGNVTAEAGALSPESTVGAAGLAPTGWMDGVRVNVNTTIGNIKVVAGSLGDFKTPNAFERKFQGNFLELEVDHKFLENILTQTAIERYNGEEYIQEDIQINLKVLGNKVFKVFADALYDVQRNAYNYEVGTDIDVLKNMMNKYDNRVDLKLYYSELNQNIPNRNSLITSFYTYGPRFTAEVGGKLDKAGNINWFVRGAFGQQNRYDAGIKIKIPGIKH